MASASLLFCSAFLLIGGPCSARSWTDKEGNTLEAEFTRLRNAMVYLKTVDEVVPVSINRLSEADQEWIKRYQALHRTRRWNASQGEAMRGAFVGVRDGELRIRQGRDLIKLPLATIAPEDWQHIQSIYEHLDQTPPQEFLSLRPARRAPPPPAVAPEGPTRDWIDQTGRRITAVYAGTRGEKVLLWVRDKEYAYPVDKLSRADREWIARQNLGKLGEQAGSALAFASQLFSGASAVPRPPAPDAQPASRPRNPSPPPIAQPLASRVPERPRPQAPPPPEPPAVVEREPEPERPKAAPKPVSVVIDDIDELTDEEYEQRLIDAFGNSEETEYEGIASCGHCGAEYAYPVGYNEGSPCPFCTKPVDELLKFEDMELDISFGGSSTPWYFRRSFRRLIIFLLIFAAGTVAKYLANAATTGET